MSAIPVFDELAASYEHAVNCDTANTVYGDLSVESDCTSRKSFREMLISFDGDSGSQWLGCWI